MKVLTGIVLLLALSAGFFADDLGAWLFPAQRDMNHYCLLSQQSCEQAGVSMRLEPVISASATTHRLTVNWPNANADHLILTLQGLEMNMGSAKFSLSPIGTDSYSSEIILPACSSGAMTWLGELSNGQQTVYPAIKVAH
ncbi:MAG: hypothetical protein ACRCTB_03790 [Vibrio sp.]